MAKLTETLFLSCGIVIAKAKLHFERDDKLPFLTETLRDQSRTRTRTKPNHARPCQTRTRPGLKVQNVDLSCRCLLAAQSGHSTKSKRALVFRGSRSGPSVRRGLVRNGASCSGERPDEATEATVGTWAHDRQDRPEPQKDVVVFVSLLSSSDHGS